MPYFPYSRKYRRRTFRKKKYKKSTYGANRKFTKSYNKNIVNRANPKAVIEPFPSVLKVRSNWCQSGQTITQAVNNQVYIVSALRLNSAHDPHLSLGIAEQVQYHQLYSRYYGEYKSTYVKVKLDMRNIGPNDCRVVCGIVDDSSNVATMVANGVNIDELAMAKYTQTRLLENGNGSKFNRGSMTFKFNLSKWWKRTNIDPEDYSSSVSTSPGEYPVLYIALMNDPPAGATNPSEIAVTTKMQLWTEYSNRNQAAIMRTTQD